MANSSDKHDLRLTPIRYKTAGQDKKAELAAAYLATAIDAHRFVEGTASRVICTRTPVFKNPNALAMRETELLFGEPFTIYEHGAEFCWGQSAIDGYVGYVNTDSLSQQSWISAPPTHRVCAVRTYAFSSPDIKSSPALWLSMNSLVTTKESSGRFHKIALDNDQYAYVISDHIISTETPTEDFVAQAEKFIETPYLWGGRTSLGLDCSALVQNSLICTGYTPATGPVLRDTDMQEATLGHSISNTLDCSLERGDLIFWRGHVGIMINDSQMLHANGTYMKVTVNNVRDFSAKVQNDSGPVTSVKRLTITGSNK